MSDSQYIDAFAKYLLSGDLSVMEAFCENPSDINRLAIYRNGFYKGCVDALIANFHICEKRLGNNNFKKLAKMYVDTFPPEQGTLVGYGSGFPDLIRDFINNIKFEKDNACQTNKTLKNIPNLDMNLVDIARLDYTWLMCLMSADSKQTLTVEYVNQLMQQEFELTELNAKLNASVLLLSVNTEAFSQWVSLKQNNNADEKLLPEINNVMFWRLQGSVQARLLSLAETKLMQSLQGEDNTLGKAFDAALMIDEEFEVSEAFAACLENELLEIT
jgi:hypothetical protein